MSDEPNGNSRNDGSGRRGPDGSFNWRGFMLFALALTLGVTALTFNGAAGASSRITFADFEQYVKTGSIDRTKPLELVTQDASMEEVIRGYYLPQSPAGAEHPVSAGGDSTTQPEAPAQPTASGKDSIRFTVPVNIELQKDKINALLDAAGLVLNAKYENNMLSSLLVPLIPLVLVLAVIYFLVRQQIRTAGRGALSFGKSKARLLSQDRNKVTFKDVAGCDEAKEEVQELVEFLKDPKKFQRLGGK
ncbi:MAG: hypothetical protein KDK99_21255, partial [Verrucomicrobiales bacterium]|nr:hypothetical protein [Verrucomicrobiales bacterium]